MFKVENLTKIREQMKKDGLKGYLIFTGDPHASEYAASHFLAERMFACPFTGSAGQVLITLDNAYLFADGRYWIQAERELKDSTITTIRVGDKNVLNFDEFIKVNKIYPLGINLLMISENAYKKFVDSKVIIKNVDYNFLNKDVPSLSKEKLFKIDEKLFSLSYTQKLDEIISKTEKLGAKANLVTTLDDIAWILNIRGNDVPCNPVFYSYLYISKEYGNHLFIDKSKLEFDIKGVQIHEYDEIKSFLKEHENVATLLDPCKVSALLYSLIKNPINGRNPSYLAKAIKGEIEANNIKRIQAIDGVALLKFGKYLEENISNNLSEYDYANKLQEFRYQSKELFELSFDTIAACGPNAAQMHYEPTKDVHSIVNKDCIELLVDSGGQYYGGTTDTTRTFLVGQPTKEYITDYTLTLKAVINLSKTIFLHGSTGQTIDIRAREYFWERGMDYKCGTGHGVSYMLNVHEGPNGFRYKKVPERDDQDMIVPGMVTTIEPGVYKQDKYGIRIENNLLCVPAFETSDGVFYKFETITYVPITTESLDLDMMSKEEIDWLNNYHQLVYDKLSPLIKDDKDLLSYLTLKTKKKLVDKMVNIVLFEPEKPANVGNIMRTCKALDANLIIVGYLTFDLSDKSLKRAGMDYLIDLNVERIASLDEFYKKYGDKNIYYVTRYSSLIYSEANYSSTKDDLFLMFGRESSGIPHDILRKYYSKTVRIPMTSDSRSLNLSNSVAILLSEVKRQQHFEGLSKSEVIKGENFLFEENN